MLPNNLAAMVGNSPLVKIAPKADGEIRILSADIGLMSSAKHGNDATSIFVNQLMLTKAGRYTSNIIFADSAEGLRTDDQALMIRKYFDEYDCDYMVLDTNGIGLGVYDCIARDITDSETGEVYPALSCCNNAEMDARCTVIGAPKVVWSIKASAQFNSDCAFMLREAFRNGRIRLLCSEYDEDEALSEIRGYNGLSASEKIQLQMPSINTTLLVDELIKLKHEESGGRVRVYERSGMRKDRYSSLSYNYYVATQIENQMARNYNASASIDDIFDARPPRYKGREVSLIGSKGKTRGW